MRICFVTSSYPKSESDGSARFVRSMAEALSDLGHEVHVVLPYRSDLQLWQDRVQMYPFRYVWPDRLAIMGYADAMTSDRSLRGGAYALAPGFAMAEAYRVLRLHARFNYDIIHAHWVIPNGTVAAWVAGRIGRPLVISLHGSDVFFAQKRMALRAAARWTFARAASVTACSPVLYKGALALRAKAATLHLIPYGADPIAFAPTVERRTAARRALGLEPHQLLVLFVGRLVEKKGTAYLLRALPAVLQAVPGVVCAIAGDGPERQPLEACANRLNIESHVRFLGGVAWSELPGLLAAADIFVAPSIYDSQGNVDGLPNTILEAMAAGCAVVASDVAGIGLAIDDNVHGLLVPEKDPVALAAAITRLAADQDLRCRLGEQARARVERELNWHAMAEKISAIYATSHR